MQTFFTMIRLPIILLILCHGLLVAGPAVRVLAWDSEVASRKIALVRGKATLEITGMHPDKRSFPLRVEGDGPILLRALDKPFDGNGRAAEIACPIPGSVVHPLVILLSDPSHPTGLRVKVLNDNPEDFPWGVYRFLNATPRELVVQLEKKAIKLPTGWTPVDLNMGGETRGAGAMIALADHMDKILYSAVWDYDPGVRTLCIIVPAADPQSGPIKIKAVSEIRSAIEAAPPSKENRTGKQP